MKNKTYRTAIVLSILAVVVSFATLICLFCIRFEEYSIDWYAVPIGSLSVLVTILVGWQIYSIIDIRRFKDDIEKKQDLFIKAFDVLEKQAEKNFIVLSSRFNFSLFDHYARNPEESAEAFLRYGLMTIADSVDAGLIDRANIVARVMNECILPTTSLTEVQKQQILERLFEIRNIQQLNKGQELKNTIINIRVVDR